MKFTIVEFKRGIIQKTIWSRVTVLLLCKLSDDALYVYEVSWKYLEGLSSYEAHTNRPLSNFKGE